jgi:perosamine synthetase
MKSVADKVVERVHHLLGRNKYALHEPVFCEIDRDFIERCIASSFVSTVGPFVNQFEQAICEFTGAKYAIATVNGTSALHLALWVAGVRMGDEVLLPSATFVASANAVSYIGAHPHFVDCDEHNLGIDVVKLEKYLAKIAKFQNGHCINKNTQRKIVGVIPVHLFGLSGNLRELRRISHHYGLKIIEDAAEALGSFYEDRHLGTIGDAGVLSFNGNKLITTGGGGMILTDDEQFATQCRHLSTTAKVAGSFSSTHDAIGFNYRMPNLNAALGLGQITRLKQYIDNNQQLNKAYAQVFSDLESCEIYTAEDGTRSNYWLQTLRLKNVNSDVQKRIVERLSDFGYGSRPMWTPLHLLPPYQKTQQSSLEITSLLSNELINLPSGPKIKIEV